MKCTKENNSTLLVRIVPQLFGPAEIQMQAAETLKCCL